MYKLNGNVFMKSGMNRRRGAQKTWRREDEKVRQQPDLGQREWTAMNWRAEQIAMNWQAEQTAMNWRVEQTEKR